MDAAVEALRAIARSVEVGHTGRMRTLPRCELIDRARGACEKLGIYYGLATLVPEREDRPASAPKHMNYRKRRTA